MQSTGNDIEAVLVVGFVGWSTNRWQKRTNAQLMVGKLDIRLTAYLYCCTVGYGLQSASLGRILLQAVCIAMMGHSPCHRKEDSTWLDCSNPGSQQQPGWWL